MRQPPSIAVRVATPALLLFAAIAPPATATGSFDACRGFVTSLPAVLTQQGTWCLDRDLSTASASGVAITIAANNVVLDCNGYKLGGLGGGAATYATGVSASGRMNATVRGCTIRGFATGIAIGGGAGHLVEDNRLDGSTVLGIALGSDLSTVRRNSVVDTGGSSSEPHQPVAVWTIGHVDVLDNTIAGVSTAAAGAEALGLRIDEPGFATIAGNRISGVVGVADTAVFGLQQRDGGRPVIRDNVLIGTPSEGTTGIACTDALATSTGNVVSGFATPIVACTSVGDVLNEL